MKLKHLILIIACLSLFSLEGISQNITISKIPLLDKLPVNAIHRILQDSEGYIWYGTVNGLCRDDGYSLKIFRSDLDTPNLMASSDITAMVEDRENKIWFGTFRGAYILNKNDYSIRPLKDERLKGMKIENMYLTSDGSIWVSIYGMLLRYDAAENLIKEYPLTENGNSQLINSLTEDRAGNILATMGEDVIYKFNEEKQTFEPLGHIPVAGSISHLVQDLGRTSYWVGTWGNGIFRFNPNAPEGSRYIHQPLPVNCRYGCISRGSQHYHFILFVRSYPCRQSALCLPS